MRPLHRFTVLPTVPKPLEPLSVLARNLRWTWHPPVQELFAAMDPTGWEASGHNPLRMLNEADAAVLERAAADPAFLAAQACWPATTSRPPATWACRWSAWACSTGRGTSGSR